jgi:hypothetical protein
MTRIVGWLAFLAVIAGGGMLLILAWMESPAHGALVTFVAGIVLSLAYGLCLINTEAP